MLLIKEVFEDLEFSKDLKINIQDVENFNFEKLTINNIKFSDISFKIHQWIGVVGPTNQVELSLLSGISNTLCRESFGSYLLEEEEVSPKIYSICYEDMWGNFSCSKFSKDGIDFNINDVSYSFQVLKIKQRYFSNLRVVQIKFNPLRWVFQKFKEPIWLFFIERNL